MNTGKRLARAAVFAALFALLAGFAGSQPSSAASAANSKFQATAIGDAVVATIVDNVYHNCLDSDYNGDVYLNPCGDRDYYQQWQAVGATLVDSQTGRCLDSDDSGRVYTAACDGDPYQTWGGGSDQALGNRKTDLAVTATDPHSVSAYPYIGLDRQHWTTYSVPGVCDPEPLSMSIDQVLPDTWSKIEGKQRSPQGIAGPWNWSVTETTSKGDSAQTTDSLGIDFTFGAFKASGSAALTRDTSTQLTYTVTAPFHAIVPQGEIMYADYGAIEHNVIFHWHTSAKDCVDLNSGPYKLTVPYAQGFYWSCEPSLDPNCEQAIEKANSGTANAVKLAHSFYPYYAGLTGGPVPPPPPPTRKATSVSYTGPTTAAYHDTIYPTAKVTSSGQPVGSGLVTFNLGGDSCVAGVNSAGHASCPIYLTNAPGGATMRVGYGGNSAYLPSSTSAAFTITKEPTKLVYSGTHHVANGEPAQLAAVLTENGQTSAPLQGRAVLLVLGEGATQQACDATTNSTGLAQCSIPSMNQPLNATATVPVTASFAGDEYYLPSSDSAQVRLQYYTGQATGLTAAVNLPLLPLTLGPTPDTGPIRTATASQTSTPCTASVGVLVLSADALCPQVVTTLKPGTISSSVHVSDVHVGLPGLPLIDISGLTASSTSTCTSATGSATLTLTVAGARINVPTAPNSTIRLPGGARIMINEQSPVAGADFALAENAVHIVLPGLSGNLVDVTVGSAVSAAHNCE